ncbi:hypothetical protein PsAD13_05064 [Pseudovibrio sp. Ad13]|nr:hypothetical protein PsAD13_05064 [Pseudovibrio sp. Ad13]
MPAEQPTNALVANHSARNADQLKTTQMPVWMPTGTCFHLLYLRERNKLSNSIIKFHTDEGLNADKAVNRS